MSDLHVFGGLWDRLVLLQADYYQFYYHTNYDSVYSPELATLCSEVSNTVTSCFRGGKFTATRDDLEILKEKISELEKSSISYEKVITEKQKRLREERLIISGYKRGDSITGTLYLYHDMGMDLPSYAVEEPEKDSYESIHLIHKDDHLIIYHDNGEVAFEGNIDFDPYTRSVPLRQDRPYGLTSRTGTFTVGYGITFYTWESFFRAHPAMNAILTINPIQSD